MTDESIEKTVLDVLSTTPYACTSATKLSGGTANFVFRGVLAQPVENNPTIVIKHTEDYIASNRDFKLSAERCLIEESILNALHQLPRTTTRNNIVSIQTPHLYHFDRSTNTQVLEDLPASLDLKSFFIAAAEAENHKSTSVTQEWATELGHALGEWLHSFHAWGDDPAQDAIRKKMAGNILMRDLKCMINYDQLVGSVARFPEILTESSEVFEKVRDMAKGEIGREDKDTGLIHGDFWTGNLLIPKEPVSPTRLFIIDWEMAQCGPRALDLGQMIAETYELFHFKGIEAARWIIQGFVSGYGGLSDEVAFRTAIHVGTHLICWGTSVAGWGTEAQVQDVVRVGRELVVRAWEKDRAWFEGGFWGCLFS